jgi:hypothetical protein
MGLVAALVVGGAMIVGAGISAYGGYESAKVNARTARAQIASNERMVLLQTQSSERLARLNFLNEQDARDFAAQVNEGELVFRQEQLEVLERGQEFDMRKSEMGWRFLSANQAENGRNAAMIWSGLNDKHPGIAQETANP